jgi:hypothetical protein
VNQAVTLVYESYSNKFSSNFYQIQALVLNLIFI